MAMTQDEATSHIARLVKSGADLSLDALEFLHRILTNWHNNNPQALLHDGKVYVVTDFSSKDYAVWDQEALEHGRGCDYVRKSSMPWVHETQQFLIEDGFSLEEIEWAEKIMGDL